MRETEINCQERYLEKEREEGGEEGMGGERELDIRRNRERRI